MIELYGFIFIVVLGTLAHFIYDWSNHNKYLALLVAVNESVWEHMKLIVFPSLIWLLVEIPFIGSNPNFMMAKLVSLLTMLVFIPVVFYSYQAIFKKTSLIFDIVEFVVAIGLGQYFSYLVLNTYALPKVLSFVSLVIYIFIDGYFLIATLMPGKSEIYKDPRNNKSGLAGHIHNKH